MGRHHIVLLIQALAMPLIYSNQVDEEYPCGIPSKRLITKGEFFNRIRGGWEARPFSLPWQVRMFAKLPNIDGLGMCGGTLVPSTQKNATDLVITAAHCIMHEDYKYKFLKAEHIIVVVGAHDFMSPSEPGRKAYRLKGVVGHKWYSRKLFQNDIALLQLEAPVPYTEYTRPACLPKYNQELPYGVTCVSSGWGLLDAESHFPSKLQMQTVKIKPHEECYFYHDPKRVLCTEGHGDSCKGDSGGPLVCPINDQYTLFGVVSFAKRDCTNSMFASVPFFMQWYKRNMKALDTLDSVTMSAHLDIKE